jgi:lipid-A-disaccharide synthase
MSRSKPPTIFFSVGEPSGDVHGAELIRCLRRMRPEVQAVGYGGPKMAEAGCRLHTDLTALAVMWFLRALANLHRFWDLVSRADRYFRHQRPDAVVMIDYPGFNWWIASRAKAHGIPVFYYVPPQIWAWGQWRIGKMRRLVDHVLCSLPFEQEWFTEGGCNATLVGHPFFEQLDEKPLDREFIESRRRTDKPWVVILPGSRTQEVESNLGRFLQAAEQIRSQRPDVRLAVAAFKPQHAEAARRAAEARGLPVEVHVGKTAELMELAHASMACSGSVSLELLYHTRPTVILYEISRFAIWVQSWFRRVKYITLVNLLADEDRFPENIRRQDPAEVCAPSVPFPEYLTWEDKSADIAAHLLRWLNDPECYREKVAQLTELRDRVARPGATERAARYILDTIDGPARHVGKPHFQAAARSSVSAASEGG